MCTQPAERRVIPELHPSYCEGYQCVTSGAVCMYIEKVRLGGIYCFKKVFTHTPGGLTCKQALDGGLRLHLDPENMCCT